MYLQKVIKKLQYLCAHWLLELLTRIFDFSLCTDYRTRASRRYLQIQRYLLKLIILSQIHLLSRDSTVCHQKRIGPRERILRIVLGLKKEARMFFFNLKEVPLLSVVIVNCLW
jgi:hypothetical protein